MNVVHCQQGSSAWFQARSSRITASEVGDAVSCLKRGGETAARARLRARMVAETLTGAPLLDEGYLSTAMKFGTEMEPLARGAYEFENDVSVDLVGFVIHPTIERSGASPDGLVGDKGGAEFKAPNTTTHIGYMLADVIPPEYEPQMMWGMACCEREWWDFQSFDPRLPRRHQRFTKRLYRDEKRIMELESGIRQFLSEVDATIDVLNRRNPGKGPEPKAKLHIDPDMGITDADLPDWFREMAAQNP